ncbi:MAG TPA: pyridoxal phosphate-dependent aminotransferase [Caulobacteraceae bacterium]|nr:pyridoxal phosphate-dependent aminotransferase [Caulobacteraceae bacterium]
MTIPARVLQSDYMRFAKLDTTARFALGSSGVADCTLAELGASLDDLALHGPNAYGYPPLVERIAGRFGIDTACVATAGGASFANHLALAAIVSPGDEVLVEDPTYELLLSTLGYLQADLRRFSRRAEAGWRLDPEAVAAGLTPRTRLVVLTNLHNPTGALAGETEIAAVARAADEVGALVLIDEVYLELMFRSGGARTAFRPEGNIVVTSSLTKAYGLSGLRCGWILAPDWLALRMRRLNDLYASLPPHLAERLSVVAFDRLPALRARANALIDANRAAYREILGGHPALDQVLFEQGSTVFPRLMAGDADGFFSRLMADHETCVVPGRFFGRPDHIRVGLGGDPAMTRGGLERIKAALETGWTRAAS